MMAPWRTLNSRGKLLAFCCIINLVIALLLAMDGSYMGIFSIIMAAFCGMATFSPRSKYMDAKDINKNRLDEEV